MSSQGLWILMIMIYTAHGDILLVPYQEYPNEQLCESWKGRDSLELGVPLTCVKQGPNI